jgi:hypothetical protein
MKKAFGTNVVTGLNIGKASHLIADHELVESENGWTDEEGAWETAPGHDVLYTGYSDISCFAAGRMNGSDHLVWMDGNTLYDNGSSVGTVTAGSSMEIKAIDDGFLILGASVPYIYDGDHVRQLGPWQVGNIAVPTFQVGMANQIKINSSSIEKIAFASGAVTVTTADTLSISVGHLVDFNNVSIGSSEIREDESYLSNEGPFTVTAVSGRTITFTCSAEQTSGSFDANGDCWSATNPPYIQSGTSTVITTSTAHGLSVDNPVYFDGISSELSGRSFTVTAVGSTTQFTIGESTTGSGAVPIGGYVYPKACGLSGEYSFYLVPTIELSGGATLTGRARGYVQSGETAIQKWLPNTRTFDPREIILVDVRATFTSQYDISGTIGTDYTPGLRLYRTKADGADAYLEESWEHGDSGFTYSGGAYEVSSGYYAHTPDDSLGAVYDVDFGDHASPQAFTIMESVGQRLYGADGINVYWSHLDGIDYWNDLDFVKQPDTIISLARSRDYCAMSSVDRLWVMRIRS